MNLAIKGIVLSALIVARATLAQMRESVGVARARAGLTAVGGTFLCRRRSG
ncbi:hypothetical protein [Halomonas borealis]|uniref:hypothetical protein n=1 Tax=Halomonas borealis TaxID=2508710 RepID=UPI001446B728|nr:hypothetical protein [Halomonas borealis]